MTTWRRMDARDKVVIWIAGIIGVFLILTLIAVFALEVMDRETGDTWGRVFDLVGVLAGGLVGFIAGAQIDRRRHPLEASAGASLIGDEDDDEPVEDDEWDE